MKCLDLFSGIGGFTLGFERAGIETVAFCEIDPYCQRVLRKHWPKTKLYKDVEKLTANQLAADGIYTDIICGGFPCQPYSKAGFGRGAKDSRDLLPQFQRLVREIKPGWVVGENVAGFMDRGLDAMLVALEIEDYAIWFFGIPAVAVGLSTMEWHLWIIASTSKQRLERFREITVSLIEDGAEKFQGSDSRGFDRWHLSSSRVCRMGERIPRRLDRLRALGNAVSPQVTELIGRAILGSV